MSALTVDSATFAELAAYYDNVLNADKSTYKSSNDEPTPIRCVSAMIAAIPAEFWAFPDLAILDPCCGNGNFHLPILFELLKHHPITDIIGRILEFADINEGRLNNVRRIFCGDKYSAQIHNCDFLASDTAKKYDLIVANPPYAHILESGKRAAKNHNPIKLFIQMALRQLKPGGYLLFISPDNWMSYSDRNTLIGILTSLQIVHLDIHGAKKHFRKIGSSFTWYLVQNCPAYKPMHVSGIWHKREYSGDVVSLPPHSRRYIPLLYDQTVHDILAKTVDNAALPKFAVETSSDLHKYTKAAFIRVLPDKTYTHRLIHTPRQTVYASRPHKYQSGVKVFIATTDKYTVFADNCGMTQSIAFIRCDNDQQAAEYVQILQHPLYVFINNICRWGNFNNVRILQQFPRPSGDVYVCFGITPGEIAYIAANL